MSQAIVPAVWANILNKPAGLLTLKSASAEQAITLGGTLTIAHGLGVAPELVQCTYKCQTAELGYSIGDEVIVDHEAYNSTGISLVRNSTNVVVRFGNANLAITRKDTGAGAFITVANWKLIARAFA